MARLAVTIVGAGHAGFHAAAALRQNGFDGRVVLIGDEPAPPYQRPPLSKAYLKPSSTVDALWLRPEQFYSSQDIELIVGERATSIERDRRRLVLASGRTVSYDHLILALGARNRPLPVIDAALEGVYGLRTLNDATAVRDALERARSDVVVIGAGFIGLEFAAVACARRLNVHVIEAADRPLRRAISAPISQFLADAHASRGARFRFNTQVARLRSRNGRVTAVETAEGEQIPAELVLVAVGVVPNVELAAAAGLAVDNGIVVDEYLRTGDLHISAIGDCAFYPSRFAEDHVRLESVQNAVDQARCVAARLVGKSGPYRSLPWFWSDQGELKLQIAGITAGCTRAEVCGDSADGAFSVFCYRGDRLFGVESINRPADHMTARRMLAQGPVDARDPYPSSVPSEEKH